MSTGWEKTVSRGGRVLKEGQRVWCKGRPATLLYYMGESAAVVRFEGHTESSVVARAALSASPPDAADISPKRAKA